MKRSPPRQIEPPRLRTNRQSPAASGDAGGGGAFAVVGIGASAGGLEASRNLLATTPAKPGMAFILIQHLDPNHDSMMVDLLAGHTSMPVRQASDGMGLRSDHVYVIPPGVYLSVDAGVLRLSQPPVRHGARLPFDFLLHSLADNYGSRALAVVLSGTGADGSLGLQAVKAKGGFVIAQSPGEAGSDGMPRSAIKTGAVDLILPVSKISEALIDYDRHKILTGTETQPTPVLDTTSALTRIIDLLGAKTAHDFTLYKKGTLQRRIERRMAMAGVASDGMERYLDRLRDDAVERDLLAKDLFINVTSFFRDPKVFDLLASTIIPDLVLAQPLGRPLRIWIAGCSGGEETYSLAILFSEEIAAAHRNIKLQIFASDVDPGAVAGAREGLYPFTIGAEVSPARLSRFFTKEDHGYRISSDLRASVVFTVQDVLADPPFSRLDFVSCRNLLIYLRPEAQEKVISQFHFALRDRGVLLLGGSETIGDVGDRYEVISKPERIYRRIGRNGPGAFSFPTSVRGAEQGPARLPQRLASSRQIALGDLCRRLVMDAYAPAAVLINRRHECLYSQGPTDRYLRVASGHPSHHLLAMVREGVRSKLRSAIQRAFEENSRVVVGGFKVGRDGEATLFSIAVQPVLSEGEQLLLICFVDEPKGQQKGGRRALTPSETSKLADLESELEATRMELQGAIHDLETTNEEHRAINQEAMSVNEEFQSTNEELLTSKEELQSLNEELNALNSQLQETLERQRTTSDDLQNILYSTDVATLFLDTKLNIRFFTPTTKSLFNIIASDVGRPLADLNSLASDGALLSDAEIVLKTLVPIEREIEGQNGAWYFRRILPYRTRDGAVEGAVITFTDITERKHAARALEEAKQQAELANFAKSRFLAAASHDLRQPLQVLTLLQGLLSKMAMGEAAQKLVTRFDTTLGSMSDMLNTLLDINQIETGAIQVEVVDFQIDDVLIRLKEEFAYPARAKGVALRVVPCGLSVRSDPRLLEQMIRNLLANALKYTKQGKVLLGCRRRKGRLSVEVWDTGVGIPERELQAIFHEYYQLDNAARERSRGLGLGLSIVERLGNLLGHAVNVRSQPGKGSVFAIVVKRPSRSVGPKLERLRQRPQYAALRTGTILVVEDDQEVRDLIQLFLESEGHLAAMAADGVAALDLAARGTIRPDILLADYNLPKGLNGLQVAAKLRRSLDCDIPVIVLTGDTSTAALTDIARHGCERLHKPVSVEELGEVIQRLLAKSQTAPHAPSFIEASKIVRPSTIFVVDDDAQVRDTIRSVLEEDGRIVETFTSCEAFLENYRAGSEGCLLVDACLPGMGGLELLQRLNDASDGFPAIMITGNSDVHMAVQAMKAGASDLIEKPIGRDELLASVERALERARDSSKLSAWREAAASRLTGLTPRQREIMELVLAGHPSKNIAADLGISQRTVENHRASIMKKTGARSLPALARLALAAV